MAIKGTKANPRQTEIRLLDMQPSNLTAITDVLISQLALKEVQWKVTSF